MIADPTGMTPDDGSARLPSSMSKADGPAEYGSSRPDPVHWAVTAGCTGQTEPFRKQPGDVGPVPEQAAWYGWNERRFLLDAAVRQPPKEDDG